MGSRIVQPEKSVQDGVHSFRKNDTSTWGKTQIESFFLSFFHSFFLSLQLTQPSTLNWTFKVPRMVWLGREVLVRLHRSRRAHRESNIDTVIGEVVIQVCGLLTMIFILYNIARKLLSKKRKKLTVSSSSKRFVTNGEVSCSVRVSPGCYNFSCENRQSE